MWSRQVFRQCGCLIENWWLYNSTAIKICEVQNNSINRKLSLYECTKVSDGKLKYVGERMPYYTHGLGHFGQFCDLILNGKKFRKAKTVCQSTIIIIFIGGRLSSNGKPLSHIKME